MIKDNCLVGCKHDIHHRYCDNFYNINYNINNTIYNLNDIQTIDIYNDMIEKISIKTKLENIIKFFNLDKKRLTKQIRYNRFYFMNWLIENLNYNKYRVGSILGLRYSSIENDVLNHKSLMGTIEYIDANIKLKKQLEQL